MTEPQALVMGMLREALPHSPGHPLVRADSARGLYWHDRRRGWDLVVWVRQDGRCDVSGCGLGDLAGVDVADAEAAARTRMQRVGLLRGGDA